MNKLKNIIVALGLAITAPAFGGGILTNTNQNISFLRNPARDAAIGIDGVYSNPAGVSFLGEGFHLSINLQNAHQTRTVCTGYGPLFQGNVNNPATEQNGYIHKFKGEADAPVIPSLQAAYNKGKWSFQFGFAITGGGGKCTFDDGLGSFEGVVASIPAALMAGGINDKLAAMGSPMQLTGGYGYTPFMEGRQYYYGFTLGAGYKVSDNLSVYGGLRMLYGSANYFGYVKDIQLQANVAGNTTMMPAPQFFDGLSQQLSELAGRMEAAGLPADDIKAQAMQMTAYGQAAQDIGLNCDQTGWGVAPIIGIDYKTGKLNLAAKYEFKTKMRLENKSANSKSAEGIAMLGKFADGKKVAEDSPAMLTVGAQYELLPQLRISAGWHHYFDVDTKQFTKDMMGDTNEYLLGAEYDINKYVQVSAGGQITDYAFEDNYMNDVSFNVSSYSLGVGVGVNVTKSVKINAAYFQTIYENYDKVSQKSGLTVTDQFTRTNRVLGLGVDLKF